jgi:hypothetical protein
MLSSLPASSGVSTQRFDTNWIIRSANNEFNKLDGISEEGSVSLPTGLRCL